MEKTAFSENELKKELSLSFAGDELRNICRAIRLIYEKDFTPSFIEKRFRLTHIMLKYMAPGAEDIISLLLYPAHERKLIKDETYRELFGDYGSDYCESTKNAISGAVFFEGATRSDCIDNYIMNRVCDSMLESIVNKMRKSGTPDTHYVRRAYELAKNVHFWARRKTGEPEVAHSLRIADRLADLELESPIVSAALLHDLVEDNHVKLDEIKNEFGESIKSYVEALTLFDSEEKNNSGENDSAGTAALRRLSDFVMQKRRNICVLYIKAADRIDDLATLESLTAEEADEVVEDTKKKYLPLFRSLGMNFFVSEINRFIMNYENPDLCREAEEAYSAVLDNAGNTAQPFFRFFSESIENELPELRRLCGNISVKCSYRFYNNYEVFGFIKDTLPAPSYYKHRKVPVGKDKIPVCLITAVISRETGAEAEITAFNNAFIKTVYTHRLAPEGCILVDFSMNEGKILSAIFEDKQSNRFECRFCTRENLIQYNMGSSDGVRLDEEFDSDNGGEPIYVVLRNGKTKKMPAHSNAIDLAFALHTEIGLTLRSVKINGRQVSIFKEIPNWAKVELISDSEIKDGKLVKFVPHARIDWLNDVVTAKARKKLTKYLEKKYESDNFRYESKTSEVLLGKALADIFENCGIETLLFNTEEQL